MRQSAICNWIDRNHIPPSWHIDLMVEVQRRKLPPVDPIVWGLKGEAAKFFRDATAAKRPGRARASA